MEVREIDKLAFICIKNGKVLGTISSGKDAFYIPGGKREPGETDKQALMREVKEELCVDIAPKTIRYYDTFRAQAHGKPEGTIVKMTCYTADFTGDPQPGGEIESMLWLTSADIEAAPPVDKLILEDLKSRGLID